MRKSLLVLTLFILFPLIANAATTIYAWGYGDILAHIIRSIMDLFNTDDFKGLFKIFLTIGIVLVILSYLGNRNQDPFALVKFYIITIGVWYLFMAPVVKTDVYIDDRQNPNYSQTLTDVPYFLAKTLSYFSSFEKVTAELMEQAFSVPTDLKYSNSGFLTAFGVMANANSHKIVDPNLYLSVNDYMNDCVFPDIVDGTKDVGQLARSNDLWTDLGNTNPARTTRVYDSSNPDGTIMDCVSAYSTISGTLNNYITTTGFQTVFHIVGNISANNLNQMLGTASDYYLNYSVTGQAYLQQAIAMNMFSEAFNNFAKVNGISSDGLALGSAKAEENARNNMVLSGALGAKFIPVIKGVLTVLIVGLIPILVLLMVTPMFKKVFFGFLMILGWLSLWHIGEVLINAIINLKASNYISTLADGSYNLLIKGAVDSSVLDYINMVSSFYWAIPTISFLIASGFSVYAMSSLSGQMAGKAQGATGGAASEMATGSMNTGSNVNTGRNWSFSSFAGMGATSALAFGQTQNWGLTENVHNQTNGLLGSVSTGQVQNLATDVSQVIGRDLPKLTSQIENAVGNINGNNINTKSGSWGDLSAVKSDLQKNKDGTVSGTVTGTAANGMQWTFTIDHGKVTGAEGSKDGLNYHYYKDKNGHDRVDVKAGENMSLSAVKGNDGDWHIQTVTGPTSMKFADEVQKQLSEEKAILDQLTTADKVQKGFKEGDSHTKKSMLNMNYDYLTSETDKTSDAYKYAYTKTKAIEEGVIKTLGRGAVKNYEQGERVDKAEERKAVIEGGVKLGGNVVGALGLKVGGKISQAWSYKDGIYVQTSDGHMYKFEWSSQAKDTRANKFAEDHSTAFEKSSAYQELQKAGITNAEEYKKARESYYQRMADTAQKRTEQINDKIQNLRTNKAGFNDDMMRFIVEDYAKRHNMSYVDAFREINQNPNRIKEEYFDNPERLNAVLSRYGNNNLGNVITTTENAKDRVENNVDEDKLKGYNPKELDLNAPIEKVEVKEFGQRDAQKKAVNNGIVDLKALGSFSEKLQSFVGKNMTPPKGSFSEIKEYVENKGLTESKVKEEMDNFATNLGNYNDKKGSNLTIADFRRDGRVDDALKSMEAMLNKWENNPEFFMSEGNAIIYQNMLKQYNELKELKDQYDIVAKDAQYWNMYRMAQQDNTNSKTVTEIDKGGLINGDPKINHYEGEYQTPVNPTHSPEYTYQDKNKNMQDPRVEYPTGFDNNPGISNKEIGNKVKTTVENSQIVRDLKQDKKIPMSDTPKPKG